MNDISKVTVTDINMNFGSMIEFMIKWFFATIVAGALVGLVCLMPILVIMAMAKH